jgi:hypothetical protein
MRTGLLHWRLCGVHMSCPVSKSLISNLVCNSAQGDSFRFMPGTVVQHLQTDDEVHAVLAAAKTVAP